MNESSQAYLIKRKYVYNRKVASPIPLSTFRSEAKKSIGRHINIRADQE